MTTILLLTHIIVATVSLIFASMVIYATARHKRAVKLLQAMWAGTLSTLATGTVLAVASHSTLGGTCLSLCTFLVLAGATHYYQAHATLDN